MKHAGFTDITVSPSGLTLMPSHSFIGASGDGWIHEPRDHELNLGVLEIKCPFSIDKHPVHCMSPQEIAIQYLSFFMEVHEDTIQLKRDHSHYMQVQGELGVMECDWYVPFYCLDRERHICGGNPLCRMLVEGNNVAQIKYIL